MSKNLSAKYYQEKKPRERYQNFSKEENQKSGSMLRTEKNIIE